jgi:hypothetical protein
MRDACGVWRVACGVLKPSASARDRNLTPPLPCSGAPINACATAARRASIRPGSPQGSCALAHTPRRSSPLCGDASPVPRNPSPLTPDTAPVSWELSPPAFGMTHGHFAPSQQAINRSPPRLDAPLLTFTPSPHLSKPSHEQFALSQASFGASQLTFDAAQVALGASQIALIAAQVRVGLPQLSFAAPRCTVGVPQARREASQVHFAAPPVLFGRSQVRFAPAQVAFSASQPTFPIP